MPAKSTFDYAIIRVVPRVEREEFINVGVVLFCLAHDYLAARIELDAQRLLTLFPGAEVDPVQRHLEAITRVCAGGPQAGPLGQLSQKERFHWLVSPRSTIVQCSPVHSGLCDDAPAALERLMLQMVRVNTVF